MILIAIATDFTPSFLSHWANERVKILFPCPSFYFYYFCAGRASVTPSLDVLITLLSLGEKGYRRLCVERKASTRYFALYVYVMSCSFITGKLQVPQREANWGGCQARGTSTSYSKQSHFNRLVHLHLRESLGTRLMSCVDMSAFLFVYGSCELIEPSFGGLVRVWIHAVPQECLRHQVRLIVSLWTVVASFPGSLELAWEWG